MSVLTTIHQPSSQIFGLFDRILLLSEGQIIYNGSPKGVLDQFSPFGLKMLKFVNPADKLSAIACDPKAVLDKHVDIMQLAEACRCNQKENFEVSSHELSRLTNRLSTKFSMIARKKKQSFCKQWWIVFKRIMLFTVRNPVGVFALIAIGIMNAFLHASMFHKIGAQKFEYSILHPKELFG